MGYPIRWDEIAAPEPQGITYKREEVKQSKPFRRYLWRLAALTFLGSCLLVLAVVGTMSFILHGRQPARLELESVAAESHTQAAVRTVVRRVGYVSISGDLVNRASNSLANVEAVVDLLDASRHTLHTESAMVARDQIAPGHSSAFEVAMADDPRATFYRLRFRKLYGADLP